MFNDSEVDKKVKYKLGIFDDSEPLETDLEKIADIMISNVNHNGEVLDTDISEIVKLKNLKLLDLKGFDLTNKIAQIINQCNSLEVLTLYSCSFKENIIINITELKRIILNNCKQIDLSEVFLPEAVLIINGGIVDVSKMLKNSKLQYLGIKNSDIICSDSLIKIKNLRNLNVDGSTLDDSNILNTLKSKKVIVSNSVDYHPLR